MKNTLQTIAIKYRNGVLCTAESSNLENLSQALMFQAEVMRLGYLFSDELFMKIKTLDEAAMNTLYREVLPILWELKGADKKWKIFYPKFPKQVMKASEEELFFNAICHYWSCGSWLPKFLASRRVPRMESAKFMTLELVSKDMCMSVFTDLLGNNISQSTANLQDLEWFLETYGSELKKWVPASIPFKETLCTFVGANFQLGNNYALDSLKTATDVLRVMTHLCEGDISLAENTKFKSWKRSERKLLLQVLERCINEDDISRHGEKWKRVFHSLHIGDYAKQNPKSYAIAQELRNGKLRTFNAKIELAISSGDSDKILWLLKSRPGELARRLDHLLRLLPLQKIEELLKLFLKVVDQIDTRLLFQLLGHFKERSLPITERVVIPKEIQSKARILKKVLPALPEAIVAKTLEIISNALIDRFSNKPSLGKVWIDKRLMKCPAPMAQRSASETLRTLARGSRLDLGDKNTLRMFVWWVGMDIDLSCVLYDQDFSRVGQISYTNLRIKDINCCHSGDITSAPRGAAEFIDIDIAQAVKKGVRYAIMNVLDFTGLKFSGYEECFAGWMTRSHPNKNEVYDPKTVEQKIDLRSETRLAAPVLFDLVEKEAIWLDLHASAKGRLPNNVESNAASIEHLAQSAILLSKKLNLYEVFSLHATARGEIVSDKTKADTVFSIEEGITPFDVTKIGAEFLS